MANKIVFMINSISDINICGILMKIILVNSLITKIFIYSAIKIMANKPPLYSILNPDTNSDSPSAKSKGVRFVSAKFVINHVMVRGISNIITHE